jgi:hypothetical protein
MTDAESGKNVLHGEYRARCANDRFPAAFPISPLHGFQLLPRVIERVLEL